MTLQTLILYIAIAAVILTAIVGYTRKGHKNWVMTFLQSFTGVLFIVSGLVKAVDPMGTAFKMEQYFTEFQYTLVDTSASFIAPLFPFLSSISLVFSVGMIVLEIILGLMLLLGHRSKLTSWAFLLLVVFFTILTGFTFLTGYVPGDVNFFQFGQWGPYTESNMRVTDCGCFGDFIKLVPKTSFFKDIVLLVPALYFVFRHKDMHQLFSAKVRTIAILSTTALLLLFCLRNYHWGLPMVDFRPFSIGTDLYQKKALEEEAAASVTVVAWKIQNRASGEIKEISNDEFLKNLSSYPKTEWEVLEQIKTKPAIEATKVSEFSIMSPDGFDIVDDMLSDSGDVFLIVAYKLKGEAYGEEIMVADTVWQVDTVDMGTGTLQLVKSIASTDSHTELIEKYKWDADYIKWYTERVNPLMDNVIQQGAHVYAAAGGAGEEKLASFKEATGSTVDWYEADDILLKTIIRSNPGVVHLKGGKVINKWHIKHLPKTLKLD